MTSKKILTKIVHHYSFHNLLVWLLLYLVAGPFITGTHSRIILSFSISLVLFFAVFAINQTSALFKYIKCLMAATLVLFWLDVFDIIMFSRITSRLIMAIYLALLVYAITNFILTERKVNSRLISAALCVYLLLGTLWGTIYDILDTIFPGSYAGDLLGKSQTVTERFQHFQYFSFVTLTTLGYGDILPQTQGASALCQTEAIIGQFFMAVLVARLVGIQVSQQFASGDD